jgi:hypothetical protein
MVQVIDFNRERPFWRLAIGVEKAFYVEGPGASPKRRIGLIGCPGKPPFNIGRIPVKQSAGPG